MAAETSGLEKLDALLADILADWNIYSTFIAAAIAAVVGYSLLLNLKEPDVHPYLLARQATEAPVRQPGESAAFRNLETPHGFPLRSGLNVKDPNAPKWTSGRNGDLRDIWRAAVRGSTGENGRAAGQRGKIYTVLGKDLVEHDLDDITQEINIIGKYINESQAKKVVVALSDSVELLAAIFAGAFYNFHVVMFPHNLSPEALSNYLHKSQAQLLIAEAGAVDLAVVTKGNKQLNHVIWVAKQGSRHLDWNEVPAGIGGELEVSVWHELVKDKKHSVEAELPPLDPKSETPSITTLWPSTSGAGEFVDYTPQNLVAAIGALANSLPRNQRLTPDDLVLSIDSLSRSYPLCWVMVALFSNASVALNSVAGDDVDFVLATVGVTPTVVIASSRTVTDYHKKVMRPHTGLLSSIGRKFQAQTLDAGRMPTQNLLSRVANVGPTAEQPKLRLLIVSYRVDDSAENLLSSEQLTDLRIFTGARVIYALTAPGVAGAIAQTHPFDYRRHEGPAHFGPPVSSVEIILTGHPEDSGLERAVEGQITVSGPAVVDKKVSLSARARFRQDYTLELCK
ncbi:hypothetical protein VTN77DRAFT_2714 [Rasamsonia byssochlamydoides]|uniref:uncharacterized protein n=1 Tax=Rasamsonia byssochlamydoides TaxID=89139 RepID=UPI003742875A